MAKSMAGCIKKLKKHLDPEEVTDLRARAQEFLDEGFGPEAANVSAAEAVLEEAVADKEKIMQQVRAQLGAPKPVVEGAKPAPEPKPQFTKDSKPASIISAANKKLRDFNKKLDNAINILSNPKDKLYDKYVETAPLWLRATPLHTLVQTFGKDKRFLIEDPKAVEKGKKEGTKFSPIKRFQELLASIRTTKNTMVDESVRLYDNATRLAKKGVGLEKLNEAMGIASFNRMTPWKSKFDQEWGEGKTKEARYKSAVEAWKDAGMLKDTGLSYSEAHKQAEQAYKALKSNKLQGAYREIVEHIANIRSREKTNLLGLIEKSTAEGTDERRDMMAKFDTVFNNIQGAYMPLFRSGDFVLKYVDADGFTWVQHFATRDERRGVRNELESRGVDPATIAESYKDKQPMGAAGMPSMFMGQLNDVVMEKAMEGVNVNDEAAVKNAEASAQNTINDMAQIWLRWQPETSALKNSVRRKNRKGFDEDMMRGYMAYIQSHASSIAWNEKGREIEDTLSLMAEDIQEKLKAEVLAETDMENILLNDLRERVQSLRETRVGTVSSFLGKMGTGWYMTSPSIALVQMSQLGILTFPKLAVKYGMGKASKALSVATGRATFSGKFTKDAMYADKKVNALYEKRTARVTEENRADPENQVLGNFVYDRAEIAREFKGLNKYQQQLFVLREAMDRNLLDITAAHEAYEISGGKQTDSMLDKTFNLAMQPMALSELTSRKATILASFDLSTETDFFKQMDDIGEVVNDTLFSYSEENKPVLLHGSVPRVIMQFQWFRIMAGMRLGLLLNNSLRGETAEVKTAARKEFAGIMGMSGLLAGALGVPFSEQLFAILDFALGDEDEPFDSQLEFTNWLNENIGETGGAVAARGLGAAVGADLSRRIGLADVYGMQNEPPPWLHGRNLAAWWAASQLGPAFSVGQGFVQGYDEFFRKGNYMKALEVASPKPIRDGFKTIRLAIEGAKTGAGKKILADEKIGPNDLVLSLLGFNPSEIAAAQSAERSLGRISAEISARRGQLARNAAKAMLSMDQDDMEKTGKAILKFNAKNPRYIVDGSDIRRVLGKMELGEFGITGERATAVAEEYDIPVYRGY